LVLRADVEAVFSRARPSNLAGAPLLLPSPTDRLLILCAHTVKHSFDRLIRLVDIAECWQARAWDLGALREQAIEEGTADALYFGLTAARARLGAGIPSGLLAPLRPFAGKLLETRPQHRRIARPSIVIGPLGDRLFEAYLEGARCPFLAEWLLLGRLRGWRTRARAVREMLFPPDVQALPGTSTTPRVLSAIARAARLAAGAAASLTLAALPRMGRGGAEDAARG
jgi:hypothetical protein